LVLGGTAGAHALNDQVPRALGRLRSQLRGWHVVHQAGAKEVEATRALYASLGIPAEVTPFVTNMPELLKSTGVAICRGGGTTLAELAAAGVPAVVVPYPLAADDHQRRNADLVAVGGGCIVLDERQSGPLSDRLGEALAGQDLRDRRGERRLAVVDVADRPDVHVGLRPFELRFGHYFFPPPVSPSAMFLGTCSYRAGSML